MSFQYLPLYSTVGLNGVFQTPSSALGSEGWQRQGGRWGRQDERKDKVFTVRAHKPDYTCSLLFQLQYYYSSTSRGAAASRARSKGQNYLILGISPGLETSSLEKGTEGKLWQYSNEA